MPANIRNILTVALLVLAAGCASTTPPAACRGEAFAINGEAPR